MKYIESEALDGSEPRCGSRVHNSDKANSQAKITYFHQHPLDGAAVLIMVYMQDTLKWLSFG